MNLFMISTLQQIQCIIQ